MTESELLSIESEVGRMKAELHIGEKCKILIATVRHLRTKSVEKPTFEQVQAAQNYLRYMLKNRLALPTGPDEIAAEKKAVAIIDAFLSR